MGFLNLFRVYGLNEQAIVAQIMRDGYNTDDELVDAYNRLMGASDGYKWVLNQIQTKGLITFDNEILAIINAGIHFEVSLESGNYST